MTKRLVLYDEARQQIRDGDLFLFRPRGWIWRAIAVGGRSEYTHASMAGWWLGRLMNVEMTSGGGRAQRLSNIVRRWPGVVDVFEANAEHRARFSRKRALSAMIDITGIDYGRWNLFRAALMHAAFFRFLVSPDLDDAEASRWPPFCSQAVAMACRRGGVDPVPNLADRLTEPGDLSRSVFFKYRFTLGWEKREDGRSEDAEGAGAGDGSAGEILPAERVRPSAGQKARRR